MNARDYQRVLNNHLLPVSEEIGGPRFMFQQDNASIHSTNSMLE